MYFFLRGIMNSKRKAFDSLPIPADPEVCTKVSFRKFIFLVLHMQGLIGRISAAYGITLTAMRSDEEDDTTQSSSEPSFFDDDNENGQSGVGEAKQDGYGVGGLNVVNLDDPYGNDEGEMLSMIKL